MLKCKYFFVPKGKTSSFFLFFIFCWIFGQYSLSLFGEAKCFGCCWRGWAGLASDHFLTTRSAQDFGEDDEEDDEDDENDEDGDEDVGDPFCDRVDNDGDSLDGDSNDDVVD